MRLSGRVCVMGSVLAKVVRSGVEPGTDRRLVRRRIRSLCFRYNTGQSGRSESNRLFRAPKARGAPFPFIPVDFAQLPVARMGIEPISPP